MISYWILFFTILLLITTFNSKINVDIPQTDHSALLDFATIRKYPKDKPKQIFALVIILPKIATKTLHFSSFCVKKQSF